MDATAVDSSTLATVAYDGNRQLLQLEFNSRAVYQYLGVPAAVHGGLMHATSKGSYFNRFIRGQFPYRRIPQSPTGAPERDIPAGPRR